MKKYIASLILFSASAHAGFFDGNKLYQEMQNNPRLFAIGYVAGVHDAGDRAVFCTPDSVRVGQIFDLIKLHLEMNPADRHEAADIIIMRVLKQHYPCPNRGTRS